MIVRQGRNKSNKKLKNYKKQYQTVEKLDKKKNPQDIIIFENMKTIC